jgi:hypothetical protein
MPSDMLERPLRLIEEAFPSSNSETEEETWNSKLPLFCDELSYVAEVLLGIAKLSVPGRVFTESKHEIIVSKKPTIVVAAYRLRPQSVYYQKTGQQVPSPENPNGLHATGIELGFLLCRGYSATQAVHLPWLSIQFAVWGQRERACFHDLFLDHRRLVERLVAAPRVDFNTACVFENVDHCRGSGAFKRLDLYFQNKNDPENNFTLTREFGVKATGFELISTLLPLMALYDASYGYCRLKKDKDRIFDFLSLLRHEI